jgi:hypothetical protein
LTDPPIAAKLFVAGRRWITTNAVDRGILRKDLIDCFKVTIEVSAIVIGETDQLTGRVIETDISRPRCPCASHADVLKRESISELINNFHETIVGVLVDENHLEVRPILADQ